MHNKKRLLTAQCYLFCITFAAAVKVDALDDAIMMMVMMMMIIIEMLYKRAAVRSGLPS
jgi:diacylglycerol kinase